MRFQRLLLLAAGILVASVWVLGAGPTAAATMESPLTRDAGLRASPTLGSWLGPRDSTGAALAVPRANAVVQPPCGDTEFDTAFNSVQGSGGGTVTFDCGSAATILFSSPKTVSSNVTIDGDMRVTLSGGNTQRLFVVNSGVTLTLASISIIKGFGTGAPADGGAIYNAGSLFITNSTFQDNQTPQDASGGAIVSYGPLSISDSLFENNRGGNGGALYVRWGAAQTTITNSTFRYNQALSATDGWGGAILTWDGAALTIHRTTVYSNTAVHLGGGIFNTTNSSLTMMDGATVRENTAKDGGGILNNGTMTLTNVLITSNHAANPSSYGRGGGLRNESGTATLDRVTISANESDGYGGGLSSNHGVLTMTNSTIADNSALIAGGGGTFSYGTEDLVYVTMAGNYSPGGGALFTQGVNTLSLKNVILASLGAVGNCNIDATSTPPVSNGFNLSSDNNSGPFSCGLNQVSDRRGIDPQLLPLGDYGGATPTMLLKATSPARDNGQCVASATIDQRGRVRPYGAACDIGAVELQGTDLVKRLFLPLVVR